MDKQDPKIISSGMSNDELYAWLIYKAERLTILRSLQDEKASLEERILEINRQISQVGLQSQIEVFGTTVDPTRFQDSQGNSQDIAKA